MDACFGNPFIKGVDEVDKQEKANMAREAMAAKGISPGQGNNTTSIGGVSAYSSVTIGITVGIVAEAMTAMNSKKMVTAEKKKRAAAQQEAFASHTQVKQIRRSQLQSFLANWDSAGFASVTTTPPVTIGNPGQHAWVTTSSALSDPMNKYLEIVSEDMVPLTEETLMAKKDGAYLIALVNVGMIQRCKAFLKEWEKEGPNSVGLPSTHCCARTLETATKHLAPLITDANKGSRLYNIMRNLQIMETDKLLSLANAVYLEALQEAGINGLI